MIYVFKTSVKTKKEIRQLKPLLDDLITPSNWNFDLDDCDKILRVATKNEVPERVIKMLQENGFNCEELL